MASTTWLTGPCLAALRTPVLAAVIAYSLALTGSRVARRMGRWFPADADPLERTLLELALGIGSAVVLLFAGGALHLYSAPFAWGLLAVSWIAPHRRFLADLRARAGLLIRGGSSSFPILLLAMTGAITLIESLAPVVAQDALVYHLAVPARWIEAGGFVPIEGNFFSSFPQNVELLFAWGLLLDGDSLAQWFHWLLGAASAASCASLARALPGRASGVTAAAIFATVPTVTLIAGWAYVDLGVVFFATASLLAFVRWMERDAAPWLLASALLAGLAAGCKYTGGLQGLLVAGGVLAAGAFRGRPTGPACLRAAWAAAIIGLAASPWWIRNIVFTGNPLHPFAHGLFGGAGWDAERAEVLSRMLGEWGRTGGILDTLLLPWTLTMSGRFFSEEHFDGVIGPVFLAGAPLVALAVRKSPVHAIVLAFAAAHAGFWLMTTHQVRFLLPCLAALSAVLGSVLPEIVARAAPGRLEALRSAAWKAVLGSALAVNVFFAVIHFADHAPLPVVLGLETRSAYMARELPCGDHAVFEHIERELPARSRILMGSLGNPGFLVKRPYHSDALFENRTLAAILASSRSPDDAYRELATRGFTHLLFRMESVFDPTGKKSEIPFEDQTKLMELLNRHARLAFQASGTYLYELGWGTGPESRP